MMTTSDITKYDCSNMYSLITTFPEQCEKGKEIARNTNLPAPKNQISNIVFTGMGGSAIGGEILSHLFAKSLKIPVLVNRGYTLPEFVSDSSLVIVSSYSGNTEETISALDSTAQINPYFLCISSNGQVEKIAKKHKYALIQVPGGQPPRTALGLLFFTMLFGLEKLNVIPDQSADFAETLAQLKIMSKELAVLDENNPALNLAKILTQKTALVYGADEPNAALPTRWRNQISENAKALAFSNMIPEMNHNEIVGLAESTPILDKIHVVFLTDENNYGRIKLRIEATKEILEKRNIKYSDFKAAGHSRLCRTFSLLYYADFVSFYLAILNKVDPTPIENIDFLKKKLANAIFV